MANFESALSRISDRSLGIVGEARLLLRDLIGDACVEISAAEGSILIPTADRTHLRFLVSINPELDKADFEFPIHESVSGFVFNSGQAIAKIDPESKVRGEVDQISKVETEFLMAVPITDAARILGVATFVNRTGEKADQPFSAEDLQAAQSLAEVYAAGLKFFQQVALSADLTRVDVSEIACGLGISRLADLDGDSVEDAEDLRSTAHLVDTAQALHSTERTLLNRVADLLLEHSRQNDF